MKNSLRSFAAMIALALAVGATLTSCGKSSSGTRPATTDIPQETLDQIAEQSASVIGPGSSLTSAHSLIGVFFPTSSEAHGTRPAGALRVDTDSLSIASSLHIYDLAGQEVALGTVTAGQVSHATFAWDWYFQHASDSLSYLSHAADTIDVSGFPATQSRWTLGGSGSWSWHWDMLMSGVHSITHLLGRHQFSGVAFEKSGVPAYPVAGIVTLHWDASWEYTSGSQHTTGAQSVTSVITFDGSRYAHLTVDGSHHYTIDLVTGELVGTAAALAHAAR